VLEDLEAGDELERAGRGGARAVEGVVALDAPARAGEDIGHQALAAAVVERRYLRPAGAEELLDQRKA
jgi:hypothetical protein